MAGIRAVSRASRGRFARLLVVIAVVTGGIGVLASSAFADPTLTSTVSLVFHGTQYDITSGTFGQLLGVDIQVSGSGATPTGSVVVKDGTTVLATLNLNSSGQTGLDLGPLPVGAHTITASYGGDAVYLPVNGAKTFTVNVAQSVVATSLPTNVPAGTSVPITVSVGRQGVWSFYTIPPPTGTITVTNLGTNTVMETVPLNSFGDYSGTFTAPPGIGDTTFRFTYSGDSTATPGSVDHTLTQVGYTTSASIVLSNGSNPFSCSPPNGACAPPVPLGYPIGIGFTAAPTMPRDPSLPAGAVPTGSVKFFDNSVLIGTASLDANGIAIMVTTTLGVGSHAITAQYQGDSLFLPAASGAAPLTIITAGQIERYVYGVYDFLLGRPAESGGLAYWSGQLSRGVPRSATSLSLVSSYEYRVDRLDAMYEEFLERGIDPSGQGYWAAQVGAGMTFEQFQSLLMGSPEYFANPDKGNGNNTQFVEAMFQDVLHRGVDSGGLNFFVSELNAGVPRSQVVAGIVYSYEHLARIVDDDYVFFLGRHAEAGGQAFWAGQLQHGARDETIVALIIGSDEFFGDFA